MKLDGRTKADYIKSHIAMEDVIEKYHKTGKHRGRTSCPFHGGENDNLGYDSRVYHCFVCGAKGDVIEFVRQLENLSFPDALAMLDRDFGLGLATLDDSERAAAEAAQRKREADERRRRSEAVRTRKIFVLFTRIIRWIHQRPEQTSVHDAQAAFLDRQCDFLMGGGIYTSDPKATARAVVQRVRAAEKEAAHAG